MRHSNQTRDSGMTWNSGIENAQRRQNFQLDIPLSDSLSSPAISTPEMAPPLSPQPPRGPTFDSVSLAQPRRPARTAPSPSSEMAFSTTDPTCMDQLIPSPTSSRRVATAPTSADAFMPQQSLYPDLQNMEFLQSPVADFSSLDQLDLGFGINWDGTQHDFSDGQQVNLFDGFFFGGQQGGMNSGMGGGL